MRELHVEFHLLSYDPIFNISKKGFTRIFRWDHLLWSLSFEKKRSQAGEVMLDPIQVLKFLAFPIRLYSGNTQSLRRESFESEVFVQ